MHSFRWILTSLGTAGLLIGMVLLTGCGGGTTPPSDDDKTTDPTKTKPKAKDTALKAGTGTIKGRVTLAPDKKPNIDKLNADLLAQIKSKAMADLPHCLDMASKEEKEQQAWVLGNDGGVGNVFVFLRPAKGSFFAVEEKDPGVQAVKDKPAVLDQPHCAFVPHALFCFPSYKNGKGAKMETGQKFIVKNSAKIAHNTKLDGTGPNTGFQNQIIPPSGEVTNLELKPDYARVAVQCNVHPWMDAFVWVMDHPYYALTDKDGNYEIKNVPIGDVNIVAWHEPGQFLNAKGPSGEPIKTSAGETVKNFEIPNVD